MLSTENLCMSCMKEIGEEKKCPYCGFHIDTVQALPYLPIRTVISNRYLVGKVLESNGEGATYIGWDLTTKKAVDIREFMPDSFTSRTQANPTLQVMLGSEGSFAELRRSFEELWLRLKRLGGLSALINVTDVVEDYGTSYAIYEHVDGISLRDFLLRSKTGYIPWERARSLLMPILSTIGNLHSAGIIHRGISPQTLIIGSDGKIKITGFCIGEARTTGSLLTPKIYDGYAAMEQYGLDNRQGPWTDIYAFAAVLYRSLIGSDPISAKERVTNDRLMVPGKFAEALPAYVINGLINALQILPQDRTGSIEQLRAELSASPAATAAGAEYTRKQQEAAANQSRKASATPSKGTPSGKKKKKSLSGGAVLAITAVSIILVGVITCGILALTVFKDKINFSSNKNIETTVTEAEQIPVPNFEGRSYVDVSTSTVFNSNFTLKFEEVYNSEIQAGYIISQSVAPDTSVNKGATITIYVSKGVETIILPNVVGSTFEEAEARLTQIGFTVSKTVTNEGYHIDGEVLSMAPIAEKSYEVGTTVILRVYEEPLSDEEAGEEVDEGEEDYDYGYDYDEEY